MLVDKSLAMAETHGPRMRYRLLETVRAYALEKLGESGEENAVRERHRDHYTSLAAELDSPAPAGHERLLELAEIEIDNLRAAFAFSRDKADHDLALSSRRHCSHCGSSEAGSARDWPGSTAFSTTRASSRANWCPRCERGRWPTGSCPCVASHPREGRSGPTSAGDRTRSRGPGFAGPRADRAWKHRLL